VLFRSFYFYLL